MFQVAFSQLVWWRQCICKYFLEIIEYFQLQSLIFYQEIGRLSVNVMLSNVTAECVLAAQMIFRWVIFVPTWWLYTVLKERIFLSYHVLLYAMSRKQTPSDFLKQIIGRPVVVKLNSGADYRGTSKYLD